MSLIIYSDPHIGVNLMANTTPASRVRLREAQWKALDKVKAHSNGAGIVCGGDFFHSHRIDEDEFLAGLKWAKEHMLILSGNHDIVNDRYKTGSMDLLRYVCSDSVTEFANTEFDKAKTHNKVVGAKMMLYTVPHCTTQKLFEESLEKSLQRRKAAGLGSNILLLHCNYDNALATKETELNLTRNKAKELLEHFNYVVLGHEHNFKTDFDDRLIVLGNTYPTNFGDISDKYCLSFDPSGEPELCPLWDSAKGYIATDWDNLSAIKPQHEWVRITGTCPPEKLHELAKAVKKMWSELSNVVAIRIDVKLEVSASDNDYSNPEVNLMSLIKKDLAEQPEMLKLWEELTCDK